MPLLFEFLFAWPFIIAFLLMLALYAIFDDERSFFSVGAFVFIVAGICYWNGLFTVTLAGLLALVWWFVAYFIAGTVWSVVKWWFHVRAARRWYDEHKAEVKERNDLPVKYFGATNYSSNKKIASIADAAPSVKSFKARIFSWISMWPLSLTWTLINDPITRLVKEIYAVIAGMLQRMSDKAFS